MFRQSYHNLVIVGRVARKPELRFTPQGTAVCDFSVAVNESFPTYTPEGEQIVDGNKPVMREQTTWFRVTCWRNLAEAAAKSLDKGRIVLIKPYTISASAFTAADGTIRATVELTADELVFLDSPERPTPEEPEREKARKTRKPAKDEIPF